MEFYLLILVFMIIGWISSSVIKSQWIRLLDVFIYGPFLIWVSTKIEKAWIKIILIFIGSTTISYNMRNLYVEKENVLSVKDSALTNPASW